MIRGDNIPWCEKYRAKSFKDVRGQDFAVDKLRFFLIHNNALNI